MVCRTFSFSPPSSKISSFIFLISSINFCFKARSCNKFFICSLRPEIIFWAFLISLAISLHFSWRSACRSNSPLNESNSNNVRSILSNFSLKTTCLSFSYFKLFFFNLAFSISAAIVKRNLSFSCFDCRSFAFFSALSNKSRTIFCNSFFCPSKLVISLFKTVNSFSFSSEDFKRCSCLDFSSL